MGDRATVDMSFQKGPLAELGTARGFSLRITRKDRISFMSGVNNLDFLDGV